MSACKHSRLFLLWSLTHQTISHKKPHRNYFSCSLLCLHNSNKSPRPSLPAVQLLNWHLRSDDWTEFTCSSQSASKTIQQSCFWLSIHLYKMTDYGCIIGTWNNRRKQTHFLSWMQFPIMCGKRENQSKVTYKHSNTYGFSFTYTFTLFHNYWAVFIETWKTQKPYYQLKYAIVSNYLRERWEVLFTTEPSGTSYLMHFTILI